MLKRAVFKTLAYHDIFDFPLTLEEINHWLFQYPQETTLQKIEACLKQLIKSKTINKKGKYYFLAGKETKVSKRDEKKQIANKKTVLAKQTAAGLGRIPFVEFIGISGSLAMGNAAEEDDIDLLIISKEKTLWITRLMAVFYLELLGKRRRPQSKKIKNKFCLNVFLDKSNLEIKNKNAYTAHEICQIKPLINKNQTQAELFEKNSWIEEYWPKAVKSYQGANKPNNSPKQQGNKLTAGMNRLLYQLQLKYMQSKMTKEKVAIDKAFFHPDEVSKKVLKQFKQYSL
jgi:predicted nucleotidyltransferase